MAATDLLGTAEVAELFGVHRKTLYRWVQAGKLPAKKMPGETGALVFVRADVERFAADTPAQAAPA